MYSQTIKIVLDKEVVNLILKKLKHRNIEEYINSKLKEEVSKILN